MIEMNQGVNDLIDEKSKQIVEKIAIFESLGREITALKIEKKAVPDSLHQRHLITDYWLAVNVHWWKSRYGYVQGRKNNGSGEL